MCIEKNQCTMNGSVNGKQYAVVVMLVQKQFRELRVSLSTAGLLALSNSRPLSAATLATVCKPSTCR